MISPTSTYSSSVISSSTRSLMIHTILKFCVTIMSRSQAETCTLAFYDIIESICLQEESGENSAVVILDLFNSFDKKNVIMTATQQPTIQSDKPEDTMSGGGGGSNGNISPPADIVLTVAGSCHPWLIDFYYICPNPVLLNAFNKLVFTSMSHSLKMSANETFKLSKDNPVYSNSLLDDDTTQVMNFEFTILFFQL